MNADQVKELLSNATPGPWAYQHGWGIQYSKDGAVGLLIWPEHGANATPVDLDLMAAAPAVAQWGLEQAQEVARLREALERIARWHGEFPHTARYWQNEDGSVSDRPMSYGTVYGSNGERDYMRSIARAALEGTS